MKILLVSSYPPTRCGIAQSAWQQAQHLAETGHDVSVMSIDGRGDVDYHLGLATADAMAQSVATAAQFDKVVLHFAPGLIPGTTQGRASFFDWFRTATRTLKHVRFEVIMHESDYPDGWRDRWRLARTWRGADVVEFHTAKERDRFAKHFRGVGRRRMRVVAHETVFAKRYLGSTAEARRDLGISPDHIVFLSCGFLYQGKGFDRAIRVFEEANLPAEAHYYIVGTARVPEHVPYGNELTAAAARLENVTIINQYLEDEEFDRWIVAANWIVLPYRKIWSSAVMARAALFGRPVIATDAGGLRDQAGPEDIVVTDDTQLAEAILACATRSPGTTSRKAGG